MGGLIVLVSIWQEILPMQQLQTEETSGNHSGPMSTLQVNSQLWQIEVMYAQFLGQYLLLNQPQPVALLLP